MLHIVSCHVTSHHITCSVRTSSSSMPGGGHAPPPSSARLRQSCMDGYVSVQMFISKIAFVFWNEHLYSYPALTELDGIGPPSFNSARFWNHQRKQLPRIICSGRPRCHHWIRHVAVCFGPILGSGLKTLNALQSRYSQEMVGRSYDMKHINI